MAGGATAFPTVAVVLIVLAPMSEGAAASTKVLTAPYIGSFSSTVVGTGFTGCGHNSVHAAKWNRLSGFITATTSSSARACRTFGGLGINSFIATDTQIEIAIPIHVSSNGSHSVNTSVNVSVLSSHSYTSAGCPAWNVVYPPPANSSEYAYCDNGEYHELSVSTTLQDLQDPAWSSSSAIAFDQFNTGWSSYSICSNNSGTTTCSNGTGNYSSYFPIDYNVQFAGPPILNGSYSFWSNGTNMVRSHHYLLQLTVFIWTNAYVEVDNLKSHWIAASSSSMNLGTSGNHAIVNSITIT